MVSVFRECCRNQEAFMKNCGAILALILSSGTVFGQNAVYTAADSVQIVQFLKDSAIVITDRNGDCLISDIDLILAINQRLTDQYGPALDVGDIDGDGLDSTAMDVIGAIRGIITYGFGDANHDGIVTQQDLAIIGQWVSSGQIEGDINLNGHVDLLDTVAASNLLGTQLNQNAIYAISFRIFDGLSQLREEGVDAFMASGCAPEDHMLGVSSTWPAKRPSWWPSNHQTGVSNSYIPLTHVHHISSWIPSGEEHSSWLSKSWPANHFYAASQTWKQPEYHQYIWSGVQSTPPHHDAGVSSSWPAGHRAEASDTWNTEHVSHDLVVSRTWWPNHTYSNSLMNQVPPAHHTDVSETWTHVVAQSKMQWPAGHDRLVSAGWGPGHQAHVSATYPPLHQGYASSSWPGPILIWPPSHTYKISITWSEPAPGPWQVFPPDHDWLTTFSTIRQILEPPNPWPW